MNSLNQMTYFRTAILFFLLVLWNLAGAAEAERAQGTKEERTERAHILVDEYYGRPEKLNQAAALIATVMAEDSNFAPAYVEAARIVDYGGHVRGFKYRPGALGEAETLLEQAIKIDPRYSAAYVLKGYINIRQRRYTNAVDALQTAEKLGSTSPWLPVNFGEAYYWKDDLQKAQFYLLPVIDKGPGKTTAERNAFVKAVLYQQMIAYHGQARDMAVELGRLATSSAHPADAWTWGENANTLAHMGEFDLAIDSSRTALKKLDYGVGRSTLAFALYGKWAELVSLHQDDAAKKYFDEAYSLNPRLEEMARDFDHSWPKVKALSPYLKAKIK